jgi:hypothetical protein
MVGAMSTDPSALPNSGVRSTIRVIGLQTGGSLAFWVSDDMPNSVWGQVGYFISQGGAPIAFFQVWNLNTSTIVMEGSTPTSIGVHTFSMNLRNGTTWAYAVDGFVVKAIAMYKKIAKIRIGATEFLLRLAELLRAEIEVLQSQRKLRSRMRRQAEKRGFPPGSNRLMQFVSDGDRHFPDYIAEYFGDYAEHELLCSIDLPHVMEYLWSAGTAQHKEGSDELAW